MKILDIGCGLNKYPGSTGMDQVDLPNVDIVHNLEAFPWPISDNSYDKVVAFHSLEHTSNILGVLSEISRILKPKGTLHVRVPHFTSDNFYSDLTHKTFFSIRSFNNFVKSNSSTQYNYYQNIYFKILSKEVHFLKKGLLNPYKIFLIHYIFNLFPRIYERYFSFIIPALEIEFFLEVDK